MVVLTGENVKDLVSKIVKVNPAGIDIAPKAIFRIPVEKIDYAFLEGKQRGYYIGGEFKQLTEVLERIEPKDNYWILEPGIYYVVFPKVKIPKDKVAFAYPRSTLNRLGLIKSQTAVFDPGYEGEFNQTWYIPIKFKVNVNEAWLQLVYFELESEVEEGYKGFWQKEEY